MTVAWILFRVIRHRQPDPKPKARSLVSGTWAANANPCSLTASYCVLHRDTVEKMHARYLFLQPAVSVFCIWFLKIYMPGPSTASVNDNIRPWHKMLFSASQIHPMISTFPVSRHSHTTALPLASPQCHGGVVRQVDEPEPCWSLKNLYGSHGCCENHGYSFVEDKYEPL